MIFKNITIKNLFSYREGVFDFPNLNKEGRNVILIHGRNGFGKTSFINSLILFFVGSGDSELRTVSRGKQYSPREYMLGRGAEWEGVFNRKALAAKAKECSISVTWEEPRGTVIATRSWSLEGTSTIVETLVIKPSFVTDEDVLDEAEQRQEFLNRRLPRSLVPLFIYDAEQVQKIAESNSEAVLEQVERLLDITSINTADNYLSRVLQKLRRDSDARQEQLRLEQLRGQYEVERSKRSQIELEIDNFEREDVDLKRRIKELEKRLNSSRASVNEQNESIVKSQIAEKKSDLESKTALFIDSFPAVAPLVCHPKLLAATIAKIKDSSQGKAELVEELRAIISRLPSRLFDEPQHPKPQLTESQTRFLKQKAELLIESEIELASASNDEGAWRVSVDRARKLESLLRPFTTNGVVRETYTSQLRDIIKISRDELALSAQLDDLSSLPETERERQLARRSEIADLAGQSEKIRERIGFLKESLNPAGRLIERLKTDVNIQERKVSEATRNQVGVEIAEKALNGIRLYRGALKQARQTEIQQKMNEHFKVLMDSNSLIQSIVFDEDYKINYLDSYEKTVGMGNISAGMKQLAAQSFLWALKDVAGMPCPVVIDTPLARIDAGHQKLLITKFYPAAAEQVIVLPTDSELDAAKYALLKPFIAGEFCLSNPKGDSTVVTSGVSMHSAARAIQ
jgi:DNA sulfur modification protein DndD